MSKQESGRSGRDEEMEWQCKGCGRRFVKDTHEEQWMHALVKHGSVEAVTFKAVMPWEFEDDE